MGIYYRKRILPLSKPENSGRKAAAFTALSAEKIGDEIFCSLSPTGGLAKSGGTFYLTLAGKRMQTSAVDPEGKSVFSSDLNMEDGLSALVVFYGEKAEPLAFGKSGKTNFSAMDLTAETERVLLKRQTYFDDALATENYFEKEKKNAAENFYGQNGNPAHQTAYHESKETQPVHPAKNEDDLRRRAGEEKIEPPHPPEAVPEIEKPERSQGEQEEDPDRKEGGYYARVREDFLSLLLENRPEQALNIAVPSAYFSRVYYESDQYYIIGMVTRIPFLEKERISSLSSQEIRLLCYGVTARDEHYLPEELKDVCSFVPVPSPGGDGYFLLAQDPVTGNTVRLFP